MHPYAINAPVTVDDRLDANNALIKNASMEAEYALEAVYANIDIIANARTIANYGSLYTDNMPANYVKAQFYTAASHIDNAVSDLKKMLSTYIYGEETRERLDEVCQSAEWMSQELTFGSFTGDDAVDQVDYLIYLIDNIKKSYTLA